MPIPPTDKQAVRRAARSRLRGLSVSGRQTASRAICRQLEEMAGPGDTVFAFWPLSTEPDLRPLLSEWLAAGVTIGLPRVRGDGLAFHAVAAFDGLTVSSMGIGEPSSGAPTIAAPAAKLVLVPGLGFARDGRRLGRGGGHYDRLLAELHPATPRIGVAFACQVFEDIPTESHDVRVTRVVSA